MEPPPLILGRRFCGGLTSGQAVKLKITYVNFFFFSMCFHLSLIFSYVFLVVKIGNFVIETGIAPDDTEKRGIFWQKLSKSYDMRMNNPGLYQVF